MALFTSENQPLNKGRPKGSKNKNTILQERYEEVFNNSNLGFKPSELLKEVIVEILNKKTKSISELELLVKIANTSIPYEFPLDTKEIIYRELQPEYKIVTTQEIIDGFIPDTEEK